VFYVLLWF
jgi:ethanolaminephosphotransferase